MEDSQHAQGIKVISDLFQSISNTIDDHHHLIFDKPYSNS
jgi:hypothetical protein